MRRFSNMSLSEIEDEARSKHIAKLDFFKTVRASVEEVGLSSLLVIPSYSTRYRFFWQQFPSFDVDDSLHPDHDDD